MKVLASKQNDRPLYITDPRDNVLVDMESNHMELTLEHNLMLILPSIETYNRFIEDDSMFFNKEVNFDNLLSGDYKLTYTNYEMEDGSIISVVGEISYDDEKIYLLKVKSIEDIPLYKIIEEGM